MKKIIALTTLLSLFSSSVFATDTVQMQIEQLIATNQFKQAYQLAKTSYANTDKLEQLFILAQLAKRNGRLMEAKKYYETMLKINPKLARIKLELADINVNLGNGERAKQLLTDVNAENLPPNVKMNVERYLQLINLGKYPKNSALSLSFGSVYDSNVNSGPDIDTVTMFGLPFKLSDDAKGNNDLGYTVGANYIHSYRLNDDMSINSNINFDYTGWSKFKKLDNLNLSAKTGISQRLNSQQSAYLPIEIRKSYVDGDGHYTSYNISPSFTHKFNDKAYANVSAMIAKRNYQQNDKKADIYSNNFRFGYQPDPSINTSLQLGYGKEDYNFNSDDNKFYNMNLTLSKSISDRLSAYVGASYSNVTYDNPSITHKKARKDDNYGIRTGLNYNVAENTSLGINLSHNKNKSNIDMNEYDRTRFSLVLNTTF